MVDRRIIYTFLHLYIYLYIYTFFFQFFLILIASFSIKNFAGQQFHPFKNSCKIYYHELKLHDYRIRLPIIVVFHSFEFRHFFIENSRSIESSLELEKRLLFFLGSSRRAYLIPSWKEDGTQNSIRYNFMQSHQKYFNEYGILDTRLFFAITRREREKGRKEKRVEKYGGFSNVWGWFTGRYYDSARFFNAPRFVISSPSPFFHVLRTRYLTRRSKKSRRRTLLSLFSLPFPLLPRFSPPFSDRKNSLIKRTLSIFFF